MESNTATKQPEWKLVCTVGDKDPITYDGWFIYEDATGVYAPEAEALIHDDNPEVWTIYRFELERFKVVNSFLVPYSYDPETWKQPAYVYNEWFADQLDQVALNCGWRPDILIDALCSADVKWRAEAYESLCDYFGYLDFDQSPLVIKTREEVEKRYAEETAHETFGSKS